MEPQYLETLYPPLSRQEEIQKILSFVKEGKSAQLVAMPGVGRGNLLSLLAYNRALRQHHLGEEAYLTYHFVLANFSEVKNRPLFDVMKFIFLELSSSLHERKREEEFLMVDQMFKEALSYQDELVLFQGLKKAVEYLTLEREITVVFMLERFETYIPKVTEDFFNNLRSLRNKAKYKFSVIFSVTRPLEDSLESTLLADFYEFIADNHVYLSLMDMPGIEFRVAYLEKLTGKTLPKEVLKQILSLTAGHGKLTRLSLEYAFANEQKDITEEILLSQKTIRGGLYEMWNFLTPDEQNDVSAIAQKNEVRNLFLENIGLIKDVHLTIPLFEDFVKESLQQEVTTDHHIVYDSTTDTITKGHLVVSDILTLSELRLLKLLLNNPGSVVERNAIIDAVWTDTKTQEGVSDQAVDQLIFRLRKKIEDDPNNPTHIQTVKGRGIKFTP